MTRYISTALVAAAFAILAAPAAAQSLGLGPRFSFVRGNLSAGTPSTRLVGGTLRIVTGSHTALEGAFDYRSYLNEAGTERVRETPMQGSLLLFVVRRTLAPYVLGGAGVYSQRRETLNAGGLPTVTATERRVGWHFGAGAEVRIARHAAFFADYRFRFVKFGEPTAEGQERIHIPGTTIIPVLEKVKLSHEGSMWTGGVAFYF
jgi:hypothetical protein